MLSNKFLNKENEQAYSFWKLFMHFLKQHSLVHCLYVNSDKANLCGDCGRAILNSPEDMFTRFIPAFTVKNENWLRFSQLWRFYLLEHLCDEGCQLPASYEHKIIHALKANGTRQSEELEKLFEKYNIIPIKKTLW